MQHLGRDAFYLRGGVAWLPDVSFDSGVIEFDVAVGEERSFPGLAFRVRDLENYEHFYVRPHQSGNPDANQYTPVFGRVSGWQIYYGPDYSAPVRYRVNAWMHVRIEVAADSARVFIDSEEPVLLVRDLKREPSAGFIAFVETGGGAHFSNLSIEAGEQADTAVAAPIQLPEGLVRVWAVSEAMSEAEAFAAAELNRLGAMPWARLEVETNGVANLARAAAWSAENTTTLARVRVRSDCARTVRLRFGFSDRARLYLNGALLYEGDDTYQSRDYRFLGTVGLHDAAPLRLRRGDNEIVLAVSEAFGGWAAVAAFDETTGLSFDQ